MLNWINTHPFLSLLIVAWTLAWKGLALWKAAERNQKYWFVAMLVVSTVGILEIIYIFFIANKYKVEVIQD
ncbi:DUF5652 family protein [Candidatus Parcubacteria bacterium]|nr:DUF5652 family protein [Candidatus Parcubacteria bacterium]